ncbi:hypothetical protein [Brevibacterium sandarakinum]|uniref:hypothetical protein n=1 Tax=Brevibacterium sandarakinum TaxID=629680 RepID=UPI001E3DB134|nr:hypothetical protein [Brevibacterium sandarakinum]
MADEPSDTVFVPADFEPGVFAPLVFVAEESVPVDLDVVDVELACFAPAELFPEKVFLAPA